MSIVEKGKQVIIMTIAEQIKVLCVRCNVSEAELARRLGKSPQNFNSKMKKSKFYYYRFGKSGRCIGC